MAAINLRAATAPACLTMQEDAEPSRSAHSSEHEQYEKRLSSYGVGSPLRGPDGRECRGSFKGVRKTNDPRVVAVLASPHKCPERYRERIANMTKAEIEFYKKLQDGPHIPRLYDSFSCEGCRYATIQENVGPDLFNTYFSGSNPNRSKITIWKVERIAKQLLEAVRYLHAKGILHGDIKPENCSTNDEGNSFLFDFGFSEEIGDHKTRRVKYTRLYRPPETVLNMGTGLSGDIWAFGAMLFEFGTKTRLIPVDDGQTPEQIRQADIDMLHAFQDRLDSNYDLEVLSVLRPDLVEDGPSGKQLKPRSIVPLLPVQECFGAPENPHARQLADLITKMLVFPPENRITAEAALCHPFFTSQESTDRSFKLNVTGAQKAVGMHILIDGKLCSTINLSESRPNSCYHVPKSDTPYELVYFDLKDPEKFVGAATLSLPLDDETVLIDTDQFNLGSEAAPPQSSSTTERKEPESSMPGRSSQRRRNPKRKLFE